METSNYWKAVISNYLMLFSTIILFFTCMCTGVRGTEWNTSTKLVVAAVALITGLFFNCLSLTLRNEPKGVAIFKYVIAIFGNALTVGGLVAIVSPLITTLAFLFKGTYGFWMCVLAWICLCILIGISSGIFVGMLKSAFFSLIALDFSSVILCLMGALAGLYGIIPCIQVAMKISGLVGFGCLLALLGGGGLGYATSYRDESVVYDSNGNPHYVVSRLGPGRVMCTDGITWRQEAAGHYSPLN